jgi:hypothetical protein
MRLRTYALTVVGALGLSLALIGQQPAAPPLATASAPADPPAPFDAHIVATGLRAGYQVVATDMNKDGRLDLIALGAQMPELVWYENPYWTRHVITRDAPRMINMAANDTDRDGIPELALAYEFGTTPANSLGKVAILTHSGDPRALWTLKEIDAIPTSHRIRFAVIDGRPILVNAPILGAQSRDGFNDPDHTTTVLRMYRPPLWKPETITEENKGVVHGLFVGDWDGDKRPDVVTAGYTGVFAHSLDKSGKWSRSEMAKGYPASWPNGGASDVAVGVLAGKRFFVTNEPFHGNEVVVYSDSDGTWPRNVIDTTLNFSHSLLVVDADADGTSEIVSGGVRTAPGGARGAKPGVFFYKAADPAGRMWRRMILDSAVAANNCVAADLNSDRRMDVACIDNTEPWTLRWYENLLK